MCDLILVTVTAPGFKVGQAVVLTLLIIEILLLFEWRFSNQFNAEAAWKPLVFFFFFNDSYPSLLAKCLVQRVSSSSSSSREAAMLAMAAAAPPVMIPVEAITPEAPKLDEKQRHCPRQHCQWQTEQMLQSTQPQFLQE
jgi:hypothetical protein